MINILRIIFVIFFFTLTTKELPHANFFLNSIYHMLKPYYWFRSECSKIYIPFHPNLYNQKKTYTNELLNRILVLKNLFSFGPASLLLGELALVPEAIYYYFRNEPFEIIRGKVEIKKMEKEFSLLNINICFLPGELPLFFGGVLPASQRVEKIGQLLLEKNADVICLYEVHELTSAYELLEILKEKYAYFYIDIGSSPLGMNSGLFIASKFKTSSPTFKPFHYLGKQDEINKGYFKFYLMNEDKIFGKIYTTHLQPYQKEIDDEIRVLELNEIIEDMNKEYNESCKCPLILCGDLNITWKPRDKKIDLISKNFHNPYAPKESYIKNHTYSCFLTGYLWNDIKDSSYCLEILDYLLLFKKTLSVAEIKTERVPMLNDSSPGNDLSDHNGLFSIIYLKE